jgi:Uma2 family endonuclease
MILCGVTWGEYLRIADSLEHRRLRTTYDRGRLVIVSPSPYHERVNRALDQMVLILVEELWIPCDDLGSTTFRRADLENGLEPDDCYYLANAGRIRGKQEIDLTTDPPPDLAIETDITSNSIRRLRICGAFGVPEIWRYDGERVLFLRLTPGRRYLRRRESLHFSGFEADDATRFALEALSADKTKWRKGFRAWVRETLRP